MNLQQKKIVLGITGSIAAYKAAYLTRLFVGEGAEVKIIITPFAKEFITQGTLSTLSMNPVLSDFFITDSGEWNSHIDLGRWADAMLIAPASANTIGKMAHGITDNLLLAVYLASTAPVMVAPAMDHAMYAHPSTQQNIQTLKSYNVQIIEPASGELASGLQGKGRMQEPERILEYVINFFNKT
jgi:phosphopantothenoylcysteine decarboxylase/phosphopantothenate--cysteine ligase